jgi:fucose permease
MKKYLLFLCIGVGTLLLVGIIVTSFPPTYEVHIASFSVSIIPPTFVLFAIGLSYLLTVLFLNIRRGILGAFFVTLLLWLLYQQKITPLSLGVILICFGAIEYFFMRRSKVSSKHAKNVE